VSITTKTETKAVPPPVEKMKTNVDGREIKVKTYIYI